jgi:glycosyltransferase involved in cell wall biosynthesis
MEQLPLVSILVPSYNQAQFLPECLESIFGQDYTQIEVLVADGGSTDGSAAIIAQYAAKLAWYVSEKDGGTADADNKLLTHAKGDMILVLNSDDYLLPGAISRLVEASLATKSPWVTAPVLAVDDRSQARATFTPRKPEPEAGLSFLAQCWIYHPATLVSKALLEGGFANTHLMDWQLWLRLEAEGYEPTLVAEPCAALRFHAGCKSFDTVAMLSHQIALLESDLTPSLATHHPDFPALLQNRKEEKERTQIALTALAGQKSKAFFGALRYMAKHPASAITRPWVGTLRRTLTGFDANLYNPMAFLNAE